ncbi:unnamed protein product [Polarella glacialis]|uniref:Uncharacterized protein n=1 Tax=Polarella glacialis TaxID=89957 RepID=A0A813GKA0_POLGL|nr:unnamed protein product [Polarella glacialis]
MDDVPGEESRDERAGVLLLAQFLSEVQKPEDLVILGWDSFGLRSVVALRELRLAAVLFAEKGSNNDDNGNSSITLLGSTYTEELHLEPPPLYAGRYGREVAASSHVSLLDLALTF